MSAPSSVKRDTQDRVAGFWSKAPSDPTWDTPRFLFGDAAAASAIKPNVLKSWLGRGIVESGRHDREASGKGSSRLFTLRSVLCIALMGELVRLGLPPARAAFYASVATEMKVHRRPDELTSPPNPECLLVVFPAGKDEPMSWSVVPPDYKGSIHELIRALAIGKSPESFPPIFIHRGAKSRDIAPASAAAVSIPAVLERIRRVLRERGKLNEEI